MEGRETATEGQRKAAAYIENHFKSLGLLPGNNGNFQFGYPIYQDSLVNASLEVNGKRYSLYNDFIVNFMIGHTSTLLCSDVVFVGNGISDSTTSTA